MRRITTQIGTLQLNKKASLSLSDFIKELAQFDIKVTHPQGGFVFTKGAWDEYERELHLYEVLAHSSFHIIWNDKSEIDQSLGRQILYAFVKQRPLILLRKPTFDHSVDAFTRETIAAHLKDLTIFNFLNKAPAEINFTLKKLPQATDYELSPRESTLIRSRVKAHFRTLLQDAKAEFKVSASRL